MSLAMWGAAVEAAVDRVYAENESITDTDISVPYDSRAYFKLNSNGSAYQLRYALVGSDQYLWDWLLSGSASDYDARAVETSGTLTSGPTTWTNLGSTQEWYVQSSGTEKACTFTLEIRDASTTEVLHNTASISLSASAG